MEVRHKQPHTKDSLNDVKIPQLRKASLKSWPDNDKADIDPMQPHNSISHTCHPSHLSQEGIQRAKAKKIIVPPPTPRFTSNKTIGELEKSSKYNENSVVEPSHHA